MWKYTIEVDGMMCGMCEAHCNSTLREAFPVKKIKSDHKKKRTMFTCEQDISEAELREAMKPLGYDIGAIVKEPYVKKGLFGF